MIDSLDKIPVLYHFTDRRNLEFVRKYGGLHPFNDLVKQGISVPAPGGNQWSRDADEAKGMDRYIHLCFRPSHPMEYMARQEGRIKDSIFLAINASVLRFDGVMFTSDVSNKSGVQPIPITRAEIDYEVLYARTDWSDAAIQQRLRQVEKYEVLVPCCVPLSHIGGL